MKVGVIGGGVVGQAVARSYLEYTEVRVYDIDVKRCTHTLPQTLDVGDDGIVFICLPTPQRKSDVDGKIPNGLDIDQVVHLLREVRDTDTNLVLRSTVPIGFTNLARDLYGLCNLVHSPEFLTARCAVTDAQIPARNIIGGGFCRCAVVLGSLYKERFPGVPILYMSSNSSELVKLATNAFFAVKVSFFNEIVSLCQKLDVDWNRVREGILSDGRISHSHTIVPGPDGEYGFGGSCLPKDLEELVGYVEREGLSAAVMRAAMERNKSDRESK